MGSSRQALSKLHPRMILLQVEQRQVGWQWGGGGHDGCPVLLTRDRNSELGSH